MKPVKIQTMKYDPAKVIKNGNLNIESLGTETSSYTLPVKCDNCGHKDYLNIEKGREFRATEHKCKGCGCKTLSREYTS